ncbi:hypothetical protein ACJRO7_027416 [Eucalyptus globulus]|uniref:Uncharacterized protein n=1 Tax=Eucalyptus globulus TaxID=34317 RepID=A0ABD3JTP4_EUCGL
MCVRWPRQQQQQQKRQQRAFSLKIWPTRVVRGLLFSSDHLRLLLPNLTFSTWRLCSPFLFRRPILLALRWRNEEARVVGCRSSDGVARGLRLLASQEQQWHNEGARAARCRSGGATIGAAEPGRASAASMTMLTVAGATPVSS